MLSLLSTTFEGILSFFSGNVLSTCTLIWTRIVCQELFESLNLSDVLQKHQNYDTEEKLGFPEKLSKTQQLSQKHWVTYLPGASDYRLNQSCYSRHVILVSIFKISVNHNKKIQLIINQRELNDNGPNNFIKK